MKWTDEQQKAIEKRGENLLVAAAAGSGKTAVLVERIKKLVLEENVPIDRMLIVTFTNAAAAEMKEKLRKSLQNEIASGSSDTDKLREQLRLMPRASISTFHAFALDVMRRFFYLIDLEPGFSICDDAERTILKEEAMDDLIESCFEDGSEEFYHFLDCYSSDRNLNKIRDIIDENYTVLQSLPYPWSWLDEKTDFLSLSEKEMKKSNVYKVLWRYISETLERAYDDELKAQELLDEYGFKRMSAKLEDAEMDSFRKINDALRTENFDLLALAVKAFKKTRLVAKKDEKDSYEEIKDTVAFYRKSASDEIKDLTEIFFTDTFSAQVEEINGTAEAGQVLKKLLKDYDERFKAKKQGKKLIDFNDIEHYCLEILQNDQAAEFYRKKYRYIFIDEYQDTNILQEEIISKVKREDNLFMVGDIKQSIYKFRLAEPEIFKRKYEDYRNCTTGKSEKIDLNQNFRSKPAVLEGINMIFEDLMEDYDEDARLYPGFNYSGPYNYRPEIFVIDEGTKRLADDEVAELKKAEIEALEVCHLIKKTVGKTIYDQKKECERTVTLRDIVILMRGVRNYAEVYYNIMKEQGIEAFIDDSESYFDTIEIDIWMKLLSIIDNRMQDIPLISVLHSEIFGFSADELGQIRIENKYGTYAEALYNYAECGKDENLKNKCRYFIETTDYWKKLSLSMPLGKFIWKIMIESGYYLEMGAMPGGTQRQMNLRALVDKAEKYASERPGSLYNFIRYIETLKHRKVQVGQVKLVGENDNLVRIMTVHKSKGLEFPVVILCGAGKMLNYTKLNNGIVFHKDIGIGMYHVNYKEHWRKQNLLYRLIKKQVHQEEYEEEIRILYVALTRAKDILYITGMVRDGMTYMKKLDAGQYGDSTYLSMIGNRYPTEIVRLDSLSYNEGEKKCSFNPDSTENYYSKADEEEKQRVDKILDYKYPFEDKRKIKSKYSVSEINREGQDAEQYREITLEIPAFAAEEHNFSAAERGTIYHKIMEKTDFVKAGDIGEEYIRENIDYLVKQNVLLDEEKKAVKSEYIAGFFTTNLGKRAIQAARENRIWKEKSFNLKTVLDGEEIMVQGIVDCFFEENGKLVLLDYKTNKVDNNKVEEEKKRLRETYSRQMRIYKEALEASTGKPVKEMYLCHLESESVIEI